MKHGLFLLPLLLIGCGDPPRFQEAKSPDGELTAVLTRTIGSMAPKFYRVVIEPGDGQTDRCEVATLHSYKTENFVRLAWRDERTVELRHGVPSQGPIDEVTPQEASGERKCRGIGVVLVPDPSLTAAVDAVVKERRLGSAEQDDAGAVNSVHSAGEGNFALDAQENRQ
jgi:hypothetical protein